MESAKKCVLVAEDDRDIVVYLKTVLRNFEVETHIVSDERLRLPPPAALSRTCWLLDVGMPAMTGIDVLRSLRRYPSTSGIVTVMLTGSADPMDVEACAGLGAVDYILKPLGHIDITRKLKTLLTPHTQ